MDHGIRKLVALPALMLVLVLVGCGDSGTGGSREGGGGAAVGCLSPGEAREEVNRLAEGFETSSEEVEAKQDAIRAIEAEAC